MLKLEQEARPITTDYLAWAEQSRGGDTGFTNYYLTRNGRALYR